MNKLWTTGHETGLSEMMAGREGRARMQKQILDFCPESNLVCFTLNIAGPVKTNAITEEAFYAGIEAIEDAFAKASISAESKIDFHDYGNEAYYVVGEDAESAEGLKRLMTLVEKEHPLGRLFDIDVIDANGNKVSREDIGYLPRRCLLCEKPAALCASTRSHSIEELSKQTASMIREYLQDNLDDKIVSRMAYNAMIYEVATTPKPGLVDLANSGSHKDMSVELFAKSAEAIRDYFGKCFLKGNYYQGLEDFDALFKSLRKLGIEAEKKMQEATSGINTHKGLIFSLGILCGAAGYWYYKKSNESLKIERQCEKTFIEEVCDLAGKIARDVSGEMNAHGQIAGARVEAASGFSSVRKIAIPAYKYAISNFDINTAGAYTLLKLIAYIDDTNMVHRGGKEKAYEAKESANILANEFENIISNSDNEIEWGNTQKRTQIISKWLGKVKNLDEKFIHNNLSPGGSADLLAITYFMVMLEDIFTN